MSDRDEPFRAAQQRADRMAADRAERRRQEIVVAAGAMSGIAASLEADRVVLEGRGLLDRWLRDAALRNIGRRNR
ncbi:MAG: hypothetical protein EP321_13605 [Sphingomonadales bacterium]|nr:MAG: hypothetical protein EP345_00415 [Sphingomonadales bacterium]TNF02457.1 MAG: hypothetical protein EP321_13605 [Sphingomonadales bacterium]